MFIYQFLQLFQHILSPLRLDIPANLFRFTGPLTRKQPFCGNYTIKTSDIFDKLQEYHQEHQGNGSATWLADLLLPCYQKVQVFSIVIDYCLTWTKEHEKTSNTRSIIHNQSCELYLHLFRLHIIPQFSLSNHVHRFTLGCSSVVVHLFL